MEIQHDPIGNGFLLAKPLPTSPKPANRLRAEIIVARQEVQVQALLDAVDARLLHFSAGIDAREGATWD